MKKTTKKTASKKPTPKTTKKKATVKPKPTQFNVEAGDVVQVKPENSVGFAGCFVVVTEVGSKGSVKGYISLPHATTKIPHIVWVGLALGQYVKIGKADCIITSDRVNTLQ
jgi:hypothetical protein